MTNLAELHTQWDARQWDPVLRGQMQISTQDEDQVVTVASKKRENVRNYSVDFRINALGTGMRYRGRCQETLP